MSKFIINGGKKLKGEIKVVGSKNAALPLIAASLLTNEECTIENVPEISDVETMLKILTELGVTVKKNGRDLCIKAEEIKKEELNPDLVRSLRASLLLIPPMLYRTGKISLPHPGGCIIGKRPVGTHFDAMEALGAKISQDQNFYHLKAEKFKGADFYMDETSVTATENALMAAVVASGKTTIRFAASEPHIVNLAEMLTGMGAKIKGAGTTKIEVEGVSKLSGTKIRVISDEIEAGTFAALAGATRSKIKILDVPEEMHPVLHKLSQMNIPNSLEGSTLTVEAAEEIKSAKIQVAPWPGFPTDLQAPFAVLATQAKGTSLIHEWMYDRRLFYIDELTKMGASIVMCDPHRALITGPTKLKGTKILSPDIRAGIGLVIAALTATGESEIDNVELIDRGYERIEERLKNLGAEIKRVD